MASERDIFIRFLVRTYIPTLVIDYYYWAMLSAIQKCILHTTAADISPQSPCRLGVILVQLSTIGMSV